MNFYYIDGANQNLAKLDGDHVDWDAAERHAHSIGLNYIHIVEESHLLQWGEQIEKIANSTGIIEMLPAGRYYVGDPCYAVPDEDWSDILDETGYLGMFHYDKFRAGEREYKPKGMQYGMYSFRGWPIAASSTAYGDGCYKDQDGNVYDVDAGMIGAVPEDYATAEVCRRETDNGGQWVDFDSPFTIHYEDDEGVIHIGHIRIKTDPTADTCFYCGDEYCDEECQHEEDCDDCGYVDCRCEEEDDD